MTPQREIAEGARGGLIRLGLSVAATLGLVLGGTLLRSQLESGREDAKVRISSLQSQLGQKQGDLRNIARHIDEYRRLKAGGLIGNGDREGWVEKLSTLAAALGPLKGEFTYTLAPPVAYGSDGLPAPDPASVDPAAPLTHDLTFNLTGIHEVELLRLLDDFRSQVKGRFRIQECLLDSPGDTGLAAKCVLRFYTLPEPPPADAAAG